MQVRQAPPRRQRRVVRHLARRPAEQLGQHRVGVAAAAPLPAVLHPVRDQRGDEAAPHAHGRVVLPGVLRPGQGPQDLEGLHPLLAQPRAVEDLAAHAQVGVGEERLHAPRRTATASRGTLGAGRWSPPGARSAARARSPRGRWRRRSGSASATCCAKEAGTRRSRSPQTNSAGRQQSRQAVPEAVPAVGLLEVDLPGHREEGHPVGGRAEDPDRLVGCGVVPALRQPAGHAHHAAHRLDDQAVRQRERQAAELRRQDPDERHVLPQPPERRRRREQDQGPDRGRVGQARLERDAPAHRVAHQDRGAAAGVRLEGLEPGGVPGRAVRAARRGAPSPPKPGESGASTRWSRARSPSSGSIEALVAPRPCSRTTGGASAARPRATRSARP